MSNASKSFTSMQATRSHRRDVNGMVGQWSTFNQMRTFLREICVPLQPADPLKSTASAALQNGLMFQPHSENTLVTFTTSVWSHGSVGRAHRSHRWGHWFESNCHHHSEVLVDQGLPLFYPPASLPRGSLFSGFTSAT